MSHFRFSRDISSWRFFAVGVSGRLNVPLQMQQLGGEFLGLDLETQQSLLQALWIRFIAPNLQVAIECGPVLDEPHVQFIGKSDNCRSAFAGRPVDRHAKLRFPALCCPCASFEVGTDFFPAVQNALFHVPSNPGEGGRKLLCRLNQQDLQRTSI